MSRAVAVRKMRKIDVVAEKMELHLKEREIRRCFYEEFPDPLGLTNTDPRPGMVQCSEILVGAIVPDEIATATMVTMYLTPTVSPSRIPEHPLPFHVPLSVVTLTGLPAFAADYAARTRLDTADEDTFLLRLQRARRLSKRRTNYGGETEQPACLRCAAKQLACSLECRGREGAVRCSACARNGCDYCVQVLFGRQRRAPGDGDGGLLRSKLPLGVINDATGLQRFYSCVDEDGDGEDPSGFPPRRFVYATVPRPDGTGTVTVYVRDTANPPAEKELVEMATELLRRKEISVHGAMVDAGQGSCIALPDWKPKLLEWRKTEEERDSAWKKECAETALVALPLGKSENEDAYLQSSPSVSRPATRDEYFDMTRVRRKAAELQRYEERLLTKRRLENRRRKLPTPESD